MFLFTAALFVACTSSSFAEEEPAITFKPIGRSTFSWTNGSSRDDLTSFDDVSFDAIDLGGTVGFRNRMKIKLHTAFNDEDFRFKDAYLEIPVGTVKYRIGNSKVPNFFNWHVSGSSKNFLERPTLRRAFGGARKFGIRASSVGDSWGWVAGVYKGDMNDKVGSSDWTVAARGYLGLSSGDSNWFFGASVRYRGNEPESLSYGDRPYTPAVGKLSKYRGGTSDTMAAGEVAFQQGPLYGVVEGAFLRAKSAVEAGRSDTLFGGYAEIGYNLTGEDAKFDFKRGALGKTKVDAPVTSGGLGLWQAAARYDVLDLRAGDNTLGTLNGGLQTSWVLALNWQPSRHVRLLANYSSAKVSHTFGSGARINALGMRLLLLL